MQLQHTPEGDPYYTQLPPGWKVATLFDFYNNDQLIINKPYLIHSEMSNRFYGFRTKLGFMLANDFALFLQMGRVYVLDR